MLQRESVRVMGRYGIATLFGSDAWDAWRQRQASLSRGKIGYQDLGFGLAGDDLSILRLRHVQLVSRFGKSSTGNV
jgi:hypothetical protein